MRRFAIIGNRAMAQGKLPLNDMAGAAGRMDVLVRALMIKTLKAKLSVSRKRLRKS